MARLIVISNSQTGLSHELGRRWVTIGRNPGNMFQITESSVSGHHCEVLLRGNVLIVRDLRSTNGTFIKDTLITEGVLDMGDTLRIGDVELRLENSSPQPRGNSTPDTDTMRRSVAAAIAQADPVERRHHVLLVDDSMAFLELAADMFDLLAKGEWEVQRACGADQALRIIEERRVDLAVLDINMPLLDGQQLLAMLHRRYPALKLAILTGLADEARRAHCLSSGAEVFLEKPVTRDGLRVVFNVLKDTLKWKQREGFSGTLQHVGLSDIIQIECLRRNSCILEVHTAQPEGQIYIESGTIIHSVSNGASGEAALQRLLSLNDGRFQLCPYRPPSERTVQGSWECLLMEAARVRDEERSARGNGEKTTLLKKPDAETKPAEGENIPATRKLPTVESKTPKPASGTTKSELGTGIAAVWTTGGD